MGVAVTGRMAVEGPDGRRDATELAGRQGRVVLASLAAADAALHRDVLADRVWGDDRPASWTRDLSALVSRLRGALAGTGVDVAIRSDGTSYELVGDDVDVRRARAASRRLTTAVEAADVRGLAEEVLRTTASPFLPGTDELWAVEVREDLRRLRSDAVEAAAAAAVAAGEPGEALTLLGELLADQPLRESAHRLVMRAHLVAGNRAAAVAAFERLRSALADELGLDPSEQTQQLHLAALGAAPRPVVGEAAVASAAPSPDVRYARSGSVSVAYQVVGDGPLDLLWVPGWVSNLELSWEEPHLATFLHELAGHARLIMFDKRGTGLSDPVPADEPPALATRVADVLAVMDHCASERAVVFGFSEGGPLAVRFAVDHPERVRGLALYGSWARAIRGDDHPVGWSVEEGRRRFVLPLQRGDTPSPRWFAPSVADDPAFATWFARYARQSASPGMALALLRANATIDVRPVLGEVRAPTVVMHREHDVLVDAAQGRRLAEGIPDARLVLFEGRDHWPWFGDSAAVLSSLVAFVDELA